MDSVMWVVLGLFIVVVAFCAKYAVSFVLTIIKPRGANKIITHQISGVEAKDAKSAVSKAFAMLSGDQQKQVTRVYMKRDDQK